MSSVAGSSAASSDENKMRGLNSEAARKSFNASLARRNITPIWSKCWMPVVTIMNCEAVEDDYFSKGKAVPKLMTRVEAQIARQKAKEKKMYGKGGSPGQKTDIDYFSEDNKGPV